MTEARTIRRATAADAAELARLLTPLGYALTAADVGAVWEAFESQGNVALVLDGADGLRGVVTLHRTVVLHRARPVGRITSLIIDDRARGQGLGRALMGAAEDALAQMGCGMVEITSHQRRAEAHAFYLHLGYERTSLRFAKMLS